MRRAPQELRTYFCTFSTANRRRLFQVTRNTDLLLATLQHYRSAGKFSLHAYVVMPDHVHLLWTPAPDISIEKALQFIKGGYSFRLGGKTEVWERGHFDKRVPDATAFRKCIHYIEQNPVVAGICTHAPGYPYSSAHVSAFVDVMPAWFGSTAAEPAASYASIARGLQPAATPDV